MANGAPTVSNGLVISGVTTTSDIKVGTGVTLNVYGGATYSGVVTATSFKGDGSQLSNITSTTINNNADNRVITGSGSANTLEGEANMRFDGATLTVDGTTTDTPLILTSTNVSGSHMRFQKDGNNKHFVGSGGGFGLGDVDDLSLRTVDNIIFGVGTSEKFRVGSSGQLGIGGANYGTSGQVLTSQGASSPIQWATLTTGKVLQMTYKRGGVTTTSNSGGWTDSVESGLNVDITPISATSRIIIQMHSVGGNTSSGRSYFLRLRRKVNNTGDTNVASFQIGDGSNGGMQSLALTHVDYDASSPFNTSHVRNYRIRFGQDGSGTARFDYATTSVLYCLEIQ